MFRQDTSLSGNSHLYMSLEIPGKLHGVVELHSSHVLDMYMIHQAQ